MTIEEQQIKSFLLRELPDLLENNLEVRDIVLRLVVQHVYTRSEANKAQEEANKRFDQQMQELRQMREESERKWAEWKAENDRRWEANEKRWEENDRRWEENRQQWEANEKRWEENQQRWKENQQRWEENQQRWKENQQRWEANEKRWEANEKRWEENQQRWEANDHQWAENWRQHEEMMAAIRRLDRKFDATIGALGARWGVRSEESFRNAIQDILYDMLGISVERVIEMDDDGDVFGYPEQIELDIVIKNGVLFIGEIKSSLSKSELYTFAKKVAFYEKRHQRTAARKFIISPMIDSRARPGAEQAGIILYSSTDDVDNTLFEA